MGACTPVLMGKYKRTSSGGEIPEIKTFAS